MIEVFKEVEHTRPAVAGGAALAVGPGKPIRKSRSYQSFRGQPYNFPNEQNQSSNYRGRGRGGRGRGPSSGRYQYQNQNRNQSQDRYRPVKFEVPRSSTTTISTPSTILLRLLHRRPLHGRLSRTTRVSRIPTNRQNNQNSQNNQPQRPANFTGLAR